MHFSDRMHEYLIPVLGCH